MSKTIAAYVLVEPNTGFCYYGSTGDIKNRLDRHYRELRAGSHHNPGLQAVWDQYGSLVEHVFPCETREEAYKWEAAYIESNKFGGGMLNVGLSVSGGDNLTLNPRREEIITEMTESLNTRYADMSADERKRVYGKAGIANGMFGRTHTSEARALQSAAQTAEVRRATSERFKGVPLKPHVKQALSEHAKTRTGEKNSFFGKTHSVETRQRIREQKLANPTIPANSRKVEVDGIVYDSLSAAARQTGISPALMVYRLQKGKSGYRYVS